MDAKRTTIPVFEMNDNELDFNRMVSLTVGQLKWMMVFFFIQKKIYSDTKKKQSMKHEFVMEKRSFVFIYVACRHVLPNRLVF